jgi:hypothetical protein
MSGKVIISVTVLAAAVGFNAAANWGIVSSCPTPCAEPRGLDGNYLVGDGLTPLIYYLSLKSGSVGSSFAAPGGAGAWGITRAAEEYEFYVSNYKTSRVYKITTTGSALSSFNCPLPGPAGINSRWPNLLEIAIPSMNVIAVVNRVTGSLVSTVRGPGLSPTACSGWSAAYITDAGTHGLYASGRLVIENIEFPTGVWKGEEPPRDTGPHEYYIVDGATRQIYTIYSDAAVAPASLGKVKALFE